MSVLLIVSEVDGEVPSTSVLGRSLAAQADPAWTTDRDDPRVTATVLVDSDSAMRPDTVAAVREVFETRPGIEALLGDAVIGGTRRLRPAWSPTRLASTAGELDLVAVRGREPAGALADRIRTLAAVPDAAVGHLPAVLVERAGPVTVDDTALAALAEHRARRETFPHPASVSFVIPTAGARGAGDRRLVDAALDAARHSGADEYEIVVVVGTEYQGDPADLAAPDVRLVHRTGPWNFSATMNLGLLAATGEAVVLLNDDVELIEPGWLVPLLDHLRDPGVGLVGAALLYPDRSIQHVGVVIDDAVPLHTQVGRRLDDLDPALRSPHEVVAVTAACAVARRSRLLEVGGFFEGLPASFNDIDLCLKLHRAGARVLVDPRTPLVHHESASRPPTIEGWEWDTFVGRWGEVVDPWYHPGHHRPDDPGDRRRNADHLPPADPDGRWALRTPTVQPRVHRARL